MSSPITLTVRLDISIVIRGSTRDLHRLPLILYLLLSYVKFKWDT